MALDPSAFAANRINFSPLLQAVQGYRQGMDANFDFRGQQELGAALAAGNMQGARDAAGKYGMDTNVLLTLGEKARQEQERQRMAEALKNPALTRGMPAGFMAALEALPAEQRAAAIAQAQNPLTAAQLASARASAAHAAGAESRAAAMHPLDLQAKQKALEASSYGQYDPEKPMYRKRPDGSLEWIEPPQGGGPTKSTIQSEAELRKEFTGQQQVKDYQIVRNAFANVQAAAKNPSAAGDLSMIFAYMKILDPNSVVREQEFANAQNAAGVPERIRNVYNRIMSGERLSPEQRNDFINQASKLHDNSMRQYEAVRQQFGTIAKGARARPDQVLIDYGQVPDPQTQQPAAPQLPQGWSIQRVK